MTQNKNINYQPSIQKIAQPVRKPGSNFLRAYTKNQLFTCFVKINNLLMKAIHMLLHHLNLSIIILYRIIQKVFMIYGDVILQGCRIIWRGWWCNIWSLGKKIRFTNTNGIYMIHSIIGIKFNIYTKIHNVTVVHKVHLILDFDGGVVK